MRFVIVGVLAIALVPPVLASEHAEETILTLYSSRKEHLIAPVLERYTELTGVKFNLHTGKPGPLLERLSATRGKNGADLLLTVDAGNLWLAAKRGLLVPVDSASLEAAVPAALRDPQNRWFGITKRARTIVYNPERVKPDDLSTYEDLAGPKWRGRLCLRTSKKVYNQSLTASLIVRHGEKRAEAIVAGWVANLATEPFSNDTKALLAVDQGQCDLTLVNSYYYGRLLKEERAYNLALFWPNQNAQGVHVNISGAGVLRFAPHPEAAQAFLEWLVEPAAQGLLADLNLEYPVRGDASAAEIVRGWGAFRGDGMNLSEAGRLQPHAVRLMDRAGWH